MDALLPAPEPSATLALLSLVQWLSPAYPTGAFAYSHGLEQAVAAGDLRDAGALTLWLADILRYGAGWNDAVLIACALRGEDMAELAAVARALAGSAERLRETEEQGAAFSRAQDPALPPLPLPLAFARAVRVQAQTQAGAPLSGPVTALQAIALFQHSFLSNLVSAGVRFIPLGQSAGQRVLSDLHPVVVEQSARAAQAGLDDLATSAFRADLAAMAHETMDVRIFKT